MDANAALLAARSEPLGLWTREAKPPQQHPDLGALRLEYTSRGDRVPGRLLLPPDGEEPFALVLLQHGLWGSKDAAYLDAAAGPWVRAGAAVASIDFPLHGERVDAKLAPLLTAAVAPAADADPATGAFVVEWIRQSVLDLARALDALQRLPAIDGARIVYAGFSLGAIVGATFCGLDPRPRAAALALGGSGLGPAEADPARTVARFAPRPLLFVNATGDATIPREASETLFEAAGEPKEILWFEGTHTRLPGKALKSMWLFLKRHLGLGDAP
jgi:dienelactone hydrolase